MIDQEKLNKLFDYRDGFLYWKESPCGSLAAGARAGGTNGVYWMVCIRGNRYCAHRLIWVYHNGDIPKGFEIDHRNQLKLDNRIENLRLATRTQNKQNETGRKTNKSGYKGVCWDKRIKRWRAGLMHKGKTINLGAFTDKMEAARVHNQKYKELFGEFAAVNEIQTP